MSAMTIAVAVTAETDGRLALLAFAVVMIRLPPPAFVSRTTSRSAFNRFCVFSPPKKWLCAGHLTRARTAGRGAAQRAGDGALANARQTVGRGPQSPFVAC